MIEPTTYSEWSDCVEVFETGEQDEDVVLAMSRGSLNWNSGVAGFFSERISGAFNTRLKRCADRMERDFKSGGDETTVVRAMLDTRRTLMLLHRVATIPTFPEMLREHLSGEIRKYAERAQQSLEDSAKHDRSGRLASLMRNNSLLRYKPASELVTSATPAPKTADVALTTVPVTESVVVPSSPDVASSSTVPTTAGNRSTLIVAGAIVAMCVVAGGAWFATRGKDSVPATPALAEAVPEKRVVALSSPTEMPAIEPARLAPKPITEQHQKHSSKALVAIVDEGEECFSKKKFDCAISAAGSALRLNPTYARAVDLKRRAEAEQKRALDSISIN